VSFQRASGSRATPDKSSRTVLVVEDDEGLRAYIVSILEENEGVQIDHYGEYIRFDRPRCLEFTLEVPKHFKGVSFIAVKLQGDGPRCSLTFSQTLAGPPDAETIWRRMLSGLKRELEGIPPRGDHGDAQ